MTRGHDTENRYAASRASAIRSRSCVEPVVVVARDVAGVAVRATLPGARQNVSQMLGLRPSSADAPSIWYAAVAEPQTNPSGNFSVWSSLDRSLHDSADDVLAEDGEGDQHRDGAVRACRP